MSGGPMELLLVLMLAMGLGVESNPKAPSATQIYRYAPDKADYTLFLDAQAVVGPTVNKIEALMKTDPVQKVLQTAGVPTDALSIQTLRTMAKGTIGIDPVTDVDWVALWAKPGGTRAGEKVLIAVKGNWPPDFLDKLAARMGLTVESVNGAPIVRKVGHGGRGAIGMTADNVLLKGPVAWIEPRLSQGWRSTKPSREAANLLKRKPHFFVLSQPSAATVKLLKTGMRGASGAYLRGFLFGHQKLGFVIDHRGFNVLWKAKDAVGFERAKLATEGGISLLRAFHHGGRGLVRLAMAWLPRGTKNPVFNALSEHQDEIIKLLDDTMGNGKFKAKVKADKMTFTVTVDAHGKKLSDVLPFGGIPLLLAPAGLLFSVGQPEPSSSNKKSATPVAPPVLKAPKSSKKPATPKGK